MSSLLSVIERDLAETKEKLLRNAFSGHALLEDQSHDIENLPLATLLFATASCGNYRSEELKPVAVGLELLRLAVEKHYHSDIRNPVERNLFLVTADYYYAKAIKVASRLKKGYVVELMVRAIADIAEIQACRQQDDVGSDSITGKSDSLFKTAATLGMRIGDCISNISGALYDFTSLLSQIYSADLGSSSAESVDKDSIEAIRKRAAAALGGLPADQNRLLTNLIFA